MKTVAIRDLEMLAGDDIYDVINGRYIRTIKAKRGNYYVMLKLDNKRYIALSRLIVEAPEDKMVDHINGNTLDNRRCNLRLCDNKLNQANRSKQDKPTSSKYKGVVLVKKFKKTPRVWQASIKVDGKMKYIGSFTTEEEAALAYNVAAKNIFGQYARLNEVAA